MCIADRADDKIFEKIKEKKKNQVVYPSVAYLRLCITDYMIT